MASENSRVDGGWVQQWELLSAFGFLHCEIALHKCVLRRSLDCSWALGNKRPAAQTDRFLNLKETNQNMTYVALEHLRKHRMWGVGHTSVCGF